MYNLARCILSDDDESKDVVSEVFAQILADDVVLVLTRWMALATSC